MADTPPIPKLLTDDDIRWLMVRSAASLSRLWARITQVQHPPQQVMHHLRVRDIGKPEPWIDAIDPDTSLSGVEAAVLLAQAMLLRDAVGREPPDRRSFCLIVQHPNLNAPHWSSCTLRLANTLGVVLADDVPGETNCSTLHTDLLRIVSVW